MNIGSTTPTLGLFGKIWIMGTICLIENIANIETIGSIGNIEKVETIGTIRVYSRLFGKLML